jgi:uncharacterized membrane protein
LEVTRSVLVSATAFSCDPKDLLAEVARRMRCPVSERTVHTTLAGSSDPNSAVGVIEAGFRIGVEVVVGDLTLEELSLPVDTGSLVAICAEQGGFALLEGVGPSNASYRIWDTRSGSREITRDQLRSSWRGRVIHFERASGPPQVRQSRVQRIADALLHAQLDQLQLVGTRASPLLLGAMNVGLLLLLGRAVWTASSAERPWAISMGLSCLFASLMEYLLLRIQYGNSAQANRFCGSQGQSSCRSLLGTAASSFRGIPFAGIGWSYHTACACLMAFGHPAAFWLVGATSVPALLLSIRLVRVQFRQGRFCRLCNTVHCSTVILLASFALGFASQLPAPAELVPAALIFAVLLLLLGAGVLPHLISADELRRYRVDEKLRDLSLTTAIECVSSAPRIEGTPSGGIRLFGEGAPVKALVAADITCNQCGLLVRELLGRQKSLEPWVDLSIIIIPGQITPKTARMAIALLAVGLDRGSQAFLDALMLVKDRVGRVLAAEDPGVLLEDWLALGQVNAETWERAEREINEVSSRIDEYGRYFPWLWLNDRIVVERPLAAMIRLPELIAMRVIDPMSNDLVSSRQPKDPQPTA